MQPEAVRFIQEANQITIANRRLSLRFSLRPPGSLLSIASEALGIELMDHRQASLGAELWRLELPESFHLPGLGARKGQEFTHRFSEGENGAGRLEMEWRNLLAPPATIPVVVGLTLLLPPDSPLCFCRSWMQLPVEFAGAGVKFIFPNLAPLAPPNPEAAALFLPLSGGVLVPNPGANLSPQAEWFYPGELTMQFAGLEMPSRQACLYLAAQDGKGNIKSFRAGSDEQGQLSLAIVNFVQAGKAEKINLAYDVVFGLLPGGWPEAAEAYKAWALKQFWPEKAPGRAGATTQKEKFNGLWLLSRGAGNQVAPAALILQRQANASIRLLWQWWHGCPARSHYPDYFPPREGEAAFTAALASLKGAGIQAWAGVDAVSVSTRSVNWESSHLKEQASLNEAGGLLEVKDNPFADDLSVMMCPSTGVWPTLLGNIGRRVQQLGAAGLWLERMSPGGDNVRCFASAHPHPQGAGDYYANCFAALPGPSIGADPPELYLPFLEAAVMSGPSWEREGRPKGLRSDAWEPIPLLETVYQEKLLFVGLIGPLNNIFPQDPLWPSLPARLRGGEESLLRGDYSIQFNLEASRALLWGHQLGLMDFAPNSQRDNDALAKLALVRALLQLNATEPALARGQLLGPVATRGEEIEVDFLVNSVYSQPGKRRVFSRKMPAVLATAWRGSQGRTLLIITNLQDKQTEFSCELPLVRLGIVAPGKVVGLTFSPELGGHPAQLNLQSHTISGRLPARSASIIWL